MTTQADTQQLIAQAIDAKCRLEDNFELFKSLNKVLSSIDDTRKKNDLVSRLLWDQSKEEHEYLALLIEAL